MNWQDRYDGLPFTRNQVDEIGALLKLDTHDRAKFTAESIARALALYQFGHDAKKRMGPTADIARKLAQIAAAASALSTLLEDEAVCAPPCAGLWEALGSAPELQNLDRDPLWGDKTVELSALRQLTKALATSSGKLAGNDKLMRGYYFLPPPQSANNNLETATVWPILFTIWEQHGNRVAGSVGGTNALHRFINLIHAGAGLGPPSLNTLNRAIQRWKQDPRRDRPKNAAWYFGGPTGELGTIEEAQNPA